jgi:hypothetical protein
MRNAFSLSPLQEYRDVLAVVQETGVSADDSNRCCRKIAITLIDLVLSLIACYQQLSRNTTRGRTFHTSQHGVLPLFQSVTKSL